MKYFLHGSKSSKFTEGWKKKFLGKHYSTRLINTKNMLRSQFSQWLIIVSSQIIFESFDTKVQIKESLRVFSFGLEKLIFFKFFFRNDWWKKRKKLCTRKQFFEKWLNSRGSTGSLVQLVAFNDINFYRKRNFFSLFGNNKCNRHNYGIFIWVIKISAIESFLLIITFNGNCVSVCHTLKWTSTKYSFVNFLNKFISSYWHGL